MSSMSLRAAAALAFVGSVLLAQTAVAGPASAATPTCTKSVTYQSAIVPASSSGSVTCLMSRGANSDAVYKLQDTLNDCYAAALESTDRNLWPITRDGDFGPNTQKALRQVQAREGIDDDGKYGPQTRANIKHSKAVYDASSPCKYVS